MVEVILTMSKYDHNFCSLASLREAISEKNLLLFRKSSNCLTPPPPFFWNSLMIFFLNHILDTLKFFNIWILVILSHFSWKTSKPMKTSSSKCLDFGHPLTFFCGKRPNQWNKIPQNVWNLVIPPPLI